ncbi:MAG: hypothetical protein OXR82_16180 [Gammaproteobacteria bacterium]|nr:hypothetical protein [Gammaproteobacteria bacterium]
MDTAYERGWSELRNSVLLDKAEEHGYELLITTDQSLRHQQDLAARGLAVLVLRSTAWPRIRVRIDEIRSVVNKMQQGQFREVEV